MKMQLVYTYPLDEEKKQDAVVTVEEGGYGLCFDVFDGNTRWSFGLDLFHLSDETLPEDKGCVQVIAYNPKDPDGDPVQKLRVWPDGRVETFEN